MRKLLVFAVILGLAGGAGAVPQDGVGPKLRETWTAAADWLGSAPDASGAWMQSAAGRPAPSPAYTGLIVTALGNAPSDLKARYKAPVDKAVGYLLSKVNSDGSVGEGPTGAFQKTYTTGIALMALASVERTSKVADAIRGAQAYLKQHQLKEGINRGGSGYGDDSGTKLGIANMSTTG